MLKQILDPDSKPSLVLGRFFRWGMLVRFLGLFGWALSSSLGRANGDWQQVVQRCAAPSLLLVSHLALGFEWPRRVRWAVYGVALVWLVLAIWLLERDLAED